MSSRPLPPSAPLRLFRRLLLPYALLLASHTSLAQEAEREGCTAIVDEAKFGRPKAQANKYTVTTLWRKEGNAVVVKAKSSANGVGTSATESAWYPVGVGWVVLDYARDLYFRVNYLPQRGYMLDAMISELGSASCTWG